MSWLPEMAHKYPPRVYRLEYRVSVSAIPLDPGRVIDEVLHTRSLEGEGGLSGGWTVEFPMATRVYGLIPREIDEVVTLQLHQRPENWALVLECHPTEMHNAHATGLAGVLAVAAVVWFAGGLAAGFLGALTTVIAGSLLVEVTRHWAIEAQERKLRLLLDEIGSALWPKPSARITSSFEVVS